MGRNWGPPEEHDTKRQNQLITFGPFAFSRNPIYLGLFLFVLGYSLTLKSMLFPLAFLALIYFNHAALKEEEILEKLFGKKYLHYKKRVRRFL